jgi:hypothetical protein
LLAHHGSSESIREAWFVNQPVFLFLVLIHNHIILLSNNKSRNMFLSFVGVSVVCFVRHVMNFLFRMSPHAGLRFAVAGADSS